MKEINKEKFNIQAKPCLKEFLLKAMKAYTISYQGRIYLKSLQRS